MVGFVACQGHLCVSNLYGKDLLFVPWRFSWVSVINPSFGGHFSVITGGCVHRFSFIIHLGLILLTYSAYLILLYLLLKVLRNYVVCLKIVFRCTDM